MRRVIAIAGALVVLVFSASAAAQSSGSAESGAEATEGQKTAAADTLDEEALRQRVVYLLSGYHFSPSREHLDEVADPSRVAATLREIVSDTSMRPSLRGRAVDTLALYDDDKTIVFLEKLLAPPDDELSEEKRRIAVDLRHRAILSYAENRSASQAVARLTPLLENGDRQIQLTVVAAFGQYTGEAGKKKLLALAQRIEDDIVRDELGKYVDLDRVPETED